MDNNQKKLSLQFLAVIATSKLAEKAAEMFKRDNMPLQYRFNAEGTASSEIMDMLGFGIVDKCMLLSIVPKQFSKAMLKQLHTELKLDTVNSGIAFTVPINGVNNLIIRMMTHVVDECESVLEKRSENSMAEEKHVLIAAVVNRGFSGDVMEAAKSVGARGGTVIHSRHIATEEATSFWGLSVQEEKEIVLIIAEKDDKINIMSAITERCGRNSEACGIVTSMPIDSVMGI